MASIMQRAREYQPSKLKNIADLEKVAIGVETDSKIIEWTDAEGSHKKEIEIAIIDGEEYKVPIPVLGQLKELAIELPDMQYFKVKKTGTGMATRYSVIPLMDYTEEKIR